MKKSWFKPFGIIHYPVSLPGFVIFLLGLIFCIQVFMAVNQTAHSVSDLLYGIFPYIIPTILLYETIAGRLNWPKPTIEVKKQKTV